jgi:hypothetical protein
MRLILPVSLALVITCATIPMNARQAGTSQAQITFTKDVEPIFQRNCQVCHRPGSIAPMSLLTYEQARPWARSIKEQVILRQMPPWYIDKNVGVQHFSNDRSLTDDGRHHRQAVDAGALEIPPTCRHAPVADAETWQIGKPDVIVSLPRISWWRPRTRSGRTLSTGPRKIVHPGVRIIRRRIPVIHHIRTSIVRQ